MGTLYNKGDIVEVEDGESDYYIVRMIEGKDEKSPTYGVEPTGPYGGLYAAKASQMTKVGDKAISVRQNDPKVPSEGDLVLIRNSNYDVVEDGTVGIIHQIRNGEARVVFNAYTPIINEKGKVDVSGGPVKLVDIDNLMYESRTWKRGEDTDGRIYSMRVNKFAI